MTQFKVGDRVAVYGNTRYGYFHGIDDVCRRTGVVIKHIDIDWLEFKIDGDNDSFYVVHPKQCRRLKKKELRTIAANITADGQLMGAHLRGDIQALGAFFTDNEEVEFVEVRRKK